MGRVEGKVAIVTGGASGLGAADAIALAREGASVVVTDVNSAGGESVVQQIVADGGKAIFLNQDVSDESRWADVVAATEEAYGGLDILVNNAGIVIIATPEDCSLDQFRKHSAIMSEGVFLGCRAAMPAMRRRGGGSIINMSSVATYLGFPVFFAYTAAKGAVTAMTKSIAIYCQMNGFNIRCNSIHAGAIDTPMVQEANKVLGMEPPDPDNPEGGVGVGRPDDVANLVLYLASDESRFMNGAELLLDNALTIQ